jgi:UDP-GlcNAc:undecaprenyl-phosphate GlcNAc-1-phosphate transferase
MLKFSRNLGKRNVVEGIVRWASEQNPSLGGITFYIVFLVCYSIYTIIFNNNANGINIQNLGILMAFGIAFLMGLSDDAYNTKPILKFSVQLLAALFLISTGTYITLFSSEILNYL